MSIHDLRDDELIETAAVAVREQAERLDPAAESASLDRVWEKIRHEAAAGVVLRCEDIQELIPARLQGALTPERAMLVDDHTRSCLACRRALKEAREGRPVTRGEADAADREPRTYWKWAAAAAVLLALGAGQFLVGRAFWPSGDAADNMIRVVEGAVFQVGASRVESLTAGAEIPYGAQLVAPRGGTAMVTLADGSRVEMNERSRLSVRRGRGGTTIDLDGGNIIVEAAEQRDGNLWVATGDALVSVKGTVFAVHHGTKGSRVSVFEGEVRVDDRRQEHVLRPGGQVTTAQVRSLPLAEEISWSSHGDDHLALLAELVDMNTALRGIDRPGMRYQATLLDRLPASTVLYVAVPNISTTVQQSVQEVRARVAESEVLRQWVGDAASLDRVADLIERLAVLGENLGEEIVVAGWQDAEGGFVGPAALAPLGRPGAFRAQLEAEIAALEGEIGQSGVVRLVDDPWAADLPENDALLVWAADDLVVAAPGAAALRDLATALAGSAATLAGGTYHDTIVARYAQGVDSLVSIDLHALVLAGQDDETRDRLARLGVADVEQLTMEQWLEDDVMRRQAVLTFRDTRRGIASWLAAPGPMGSLSFFSPEATSVAAFVAKEPRLLFADLVASMTDGEREELLADLAAFEAEHGWSLEQDLFAPLGGEVAFGIDGPLLPNPSWKAVVEVYDPARLQVGLEQAIGQMAGRLAAAGEGSLELTETTVGSRPAWQLRGTGGKVGLEAWWTYADGYLVATASQGLLDRALRFRSAEVGLLGSARLRALLPADTQVNFSAIWYQDFSDLVATMTDLGGDLQQLSPEMREQVQLMADSFGASLVYAYGEDSSIVVSAASAHNPLGLFQLFLMKGFGGMGGGVGDFGQLVAQAQENAEREAAGG